MVSHSDKAVNLIRLTFTWNPVANRIPCSTAEYHINATNCGTCPTTTNITTATCDIIDLTTEEQLCTFVIQIVVFESVASEESTPSLFTLKGIIEIN